MSNTSDFVITKAGKLKSYRGSEKDVVVADGVVEIMAAAFSNIAGGPETITLPDSIKKINFNAFSGCRNLVRINIPDGVTHIGSGAFSHCESLKSITIPRSLKTIEFPFFSCTSLWEIIVPKDADVREKCWQAFDAESKIKYCFTNIKQGISLSQTENMFLKRSFTVAIELAVCHQDVEALAAAFATKKKIALDVIEPLLERCAEMQEVCAFILEYKQKHYSNKEIAQHADAHLEKERNPYKRSVSDWRKIFKFPASPKDGKVTIDGYKSSDNVVVIPGKIGEYTVTAISKQVFMKNRNIREVTVSEGVTEIGMQAFGNCFGLEKVILPGTLSRIGWGAFAGCIALTEISIPGSVKEIGQGAFENCNQLQTAALLDGVTEIGERAFFCCKALHRIDIPATVTSIGFVTFSGCDNLMIHAPAGSYAETYAKENSIPFVVE